MPKFTLKAARVNVHLTQKDVAESLGVSPKTVWSWEVGHTVPSTKYIEPLCQLYGLHYDDIIFLSEKNG